MGVIYDLVHIDRRERYDLDKWGNRGLSQFFPHESFTLAGRFGTLAALQEALVVTCNNPDQDGEHLRDVAAPDIWDWAGPDGRLTCVCDMYDNDEEFPDYYSMPTTGSRMFPDNEGLALVRALKRWKVEAGNFNTRHVEKQLEAFLSPLPGKGL